MWLEFYPSPPTRTGKTSGSNWRHFIFRHKIPQLLARFAFLEDRQFQIGMNRKFVCATLTPRGVASELLVSRFSGVGGRIKTSH